MLEIAAEQRAFSGAGLVLASLRGWVLPVAVALAFAEARDPCGHPLAALLTASRSEAASRKRLGPRTDGG